MTNAPLQGPMPENYVNGPLPEHVVRKAFGKSSGGRLVFHGSHSARKPEVAKQIAKRGLTPQDPGFTGNTTVGRRAVYGTPSQKLAADYATKPMSRRAMQESPSNRPFPKGGKIFIIDEGKADVLHHTSGLNEVALENVPKDAILHSSKVGSLEEAGRPYRQPVRRPMPRSRNRNTSNVQFGDMDPFN